LKTQLSLNDTLYKQLRIELDEGWKHLDYASWALSWFNDYDFWGGTEYLDYGYYWEFPEAYQSQWYTYPPTFIPFLLG